MFEWNKFLELAHWLESSTEEEKKRTAISRAYYSVYNLSKEYCICYSLRFVPMGKREDHWDLIKFLEGHPDILLRKASQGLKTLFKYRKHADYDKNFPGDIGKATSLSIKTADKINSILIGHIPSA